MEDVHRRIIKIMKRHAPGMTARLVRETRHVLLDFIYKGKVSRATIAKSPRDERHTIEKACANICRDLGLAKPRL